MFKIGQKVVCIDGYESKFGSWTLKNDVIYEVKKIHICSCGSESISVGFHARGTNCNRCMHICSEYECYHAASRFRPLDETFAESVLEIIKEQIKEEELISI